MLIQGVTYNTTMALVAGAILLMIPLFMRDVTHRQRVSVAGWGYAFIASGFFLGVSGFHMMLTWPLKEVEGSFCCTVDNVTFGEPAALFGLLAFVAGIIIVSYQKKVDGGQTDIDLFHNLRPILFIAALGGFGLILFGIAGMHFGMWRPPTIEPIARLLAGNLAEPLFVMTLYMGTGVTAILAPFIRENKWVARIFTLFSWGLGILWIFLALTVFYSHVGFFPQPDGTYI
ncbi:DUF981 family protein [Trueperella bialowiezensis]|uniref:Predicted membrane protein n=1 Tax=Trueperella bialowiezensis TaxID=312285 RepID=A0A448PGR3_9ACTO|nr:DUF981 family protein [Trueperella bialowiezensis]VEI14135.1 Predicted membrane protein [Trueperella bialowiezensis]